MTTVTDTKMLLTHQQSRPRLHRSIPPETADTRRKVHGSSLSGQTRRFEQQDPLLRVQLQERAKRHLLTVGRSGGTSPNLVLVPQSSSLPDCRASWQG
jgi:hypothetical protein